MRIRRLAALALALCLCLAGCAAEESAPTPSLASTPAPSPAAASTPYVEPAGLSLGYSAAGSLHPMEAADQGSLDVDSLVYEGLFQPDESFEPQPVLAASAEADETGRVWTVTVRSGVFFSDGTTLTARHVADSLQAAGSSPRYAARLSGIAGVQASDERTVIITLSGPNGALPALLDVPVFLEREDGLPLGTGPYAFAQGEEHLSLRSNPAWWQGREPAFSEVSLVPFSSLEERASAFGSGEVTVVTTDYNAAGAPSWSGTYETHDYPTSVMLYVGYNTAWDKPCHDVLVRRALSMAFDRGKIVTTLMAGHAQEAALPVSPASPLYDAQAASALRRDDAGAAALLEEAGWKRNDDGILVQRRKTLALTLAVNRDSAVKQSIAEDLSKSLEGLGISVTVSALDWESYNAALTNGEFDLYLGEVRLRADFDFSPLVGSGALSYGKYWGEELTAALDGFRASSGAARGDAARALYAVFAQEVPFAPLCFKTYSLLPRWGMAGSYAPLQDHPFNGIENWT